MLKNDWDEVRVENSEDSFMKEGQDDISDGEEYKEQTDFILKTINFTFPKITQ